MATKKLKKKVQRKSTAKKADNPIVDSARDIWLAGLGAFSFAQEKREKFRDDSNKMFDKLVKEGSKLEKKTRKDVEGAYDDIRGEFESRVKDFRGEAEKRVKDIRDEVESRFEPVRKRREDFEKQTESVRKQANEGWNKLEIVFRERVAEVLNSLGIPTRDDLDGLNKRVQTLSRKLTALDKKVTPAKKPAQAKPKAAAKPAAAKAAPRKAAVKKATPKAS